MKKRGISSILAAVLIILVTIGAIGIIYSTVNYFLKEKSEEIGLETSFEILTAEGYTSYFPDLGIASVQIKRTGQSPDLVGLDIIFTLKGESATYRIPVENLNAEIPEINGKRVYWFDLKGKGITNKVAVAPVFKKGTTEVIGKISSEILIESKKTSLSDLQIQELNEFIPIYNKNKKSTEEEFVFTFWPVNLPWSLDSSQITLEVIDKFMSSGFTHAGITIAPKNNVAESYLTQIKAKGYKIALEISAGHTHSSAGLMELEWARNLGLDNSMFLNAPCLDKDKCESWNKTISPTYTGIYWQNTLENTRNVLQRANADIILYDTELFGNIWAKEMNFLEWDKNRDCNCAVIKEGVGYPAYDAALKQRGAELVNLAKESNPLSQIWFYDESPANEISYTPNDRGEYNTYGTKSYCTTDYPCTNLVSYWYPETGTSSSPVFYFLPNLEALEMNLKDTDYSDSLPWISFTYTYGYSDKFSSPIIFDTSVSRKAGRMLRKEGTRGFIVYPNGNSSALDTIPNKIDYWNSHASEMIAGFKEGLTYTENNKIKNPDFESFKPVSYTNVPPYYLPIQYRPTSWTFTDSNILYNHDNATYSNLSSDKISGTYSWKHHRLGTPGTRTIQSSSFETESGDYNLLAWTKTSLTDSNSKIKFYIDTNLIGEKSFLNSWNQFTGNIQLTEGSHQLKIIIEDNTGQKVDILLDDFSLVKV